MSSPQRFPDPQPFDEVNLMTRFGMVQRFSRIDSTNRWLTDAARAGHPDGLVAIADEQTAGRGRLDRRWVAPPGSALLCSVLVRPDAPPTRWPLLTVAMALAAADAAIEVGAVDIAVKWPNDLMTLQNGVPTRKLAGILAEAIPAGKVGGGAVVVGIGVNLRRPETVDPQISETAVWLSECLPSSQGRALPLDPSDLVSEQTEGPLSVMSFASTLLPKFGDRVRQLERDHAALCNDYRTRCVTIGALVRISLPGDADDLIAKVVTIDEFGQLVVLPLGEGDETKTRTIGVGDVVHVRVAPQMASGNTVKDV
jgi:BirA family transcriptional regulator, biotin operon repressor / biotin---[acetyl-CoA-carboxylase] ligase